MGKDLLFPADAYALGSLVNNVACNARWTPTLPYRSSLTGETCQQFGTDFETTTNGQWIQSLGGSYALFEVARAVYSSVSDPKDKTEVAANTSCVVDNTLNPTVQIQAPLKETSQ